MRLRHIVWATPVCLALSAPASFGKDFATIRGKIVTCAEAFAYRDGPLFHGFQMLTSKDETERDVRRKAAIAELSKHVEKLRKDWNTKSAEQKKRLYSSLATFTLAEVVKKYGKAMIEQPGGDAATKRYAQIAIERSVDLQKTLVDTAFQSPPGAASLAGLPLGTLALAVPQLQLGAKVYEYGVFGIDALAMLGDLYLINEEYPKQIEQLEAAIQTVVSRSTDLKIAALNKVKNDIDKVCK